MRCPVEHWRAWALAPCDVSFALWVLPMGVSPAWAAESERTAPWIELTEPEATEELDIPIPLAFVTGRAGTADSAPVDLVIALDVSGSTLQASGMDVDTRPPEASSRSSTP